jgi:hypothetical protein
LVVFGAQTFKPYLGCSQPVVCHFVVLGAQTFQPPLGPTSRRGTPAAEHKVGSQPPKSRLSSLTAQRLCHAIMHGSAKRESLRRRCSHVAFGLRPEARAPAAARLFLLPMPQPSEAPFGPSHKRARHHSQTQRLSPIAAPPPPCQHLHGVRPWGRRGGRPGPPLRDTGGAVPPVPRGETR